jgi:hypothetical protein
MQKYSRGVLRLLGVLMVVALLAPMPSLLQGAKPDDNWGSFECSRCRQSCIETRQACQTLCHANCSEMFPQGNENQACKDACTDICQDSKVVCVAQCRPLCSGESPSEP